MSILEALGIFKAKIVEARNERRKKYKVQIILLFKK